jgi:hypothetical protein
LRIEEQETHLIIHEYDDDNYDDDNDYDDDYDDDEFIIKCLITRMIDIIDVI